jgi:hypothetical protein
VISRQLLLPLAELAPPPENPLDLALAAPTLAPVPLLPLAAVPLPVPPDWPLTAWASPLVREAGEGGEVDAVEP